MKKVRNIFLFLFLVSNVVFLVVFYKQINSSIWNIHTNNQMMEYSNKLTINSSTLKYQILDTIHLENGSITCGYEESEFFCIKNDLNNNTILNKKINLTSIDGIFFGDQNKFYLTSNTTLYGLNTSNFELTGTYSIKDSVTALRKINQQFYVYYVNNDYVVYDENFQVISVVKIHVYSHVYILPNGHLLGVYQSLMIFDENGKLINSLDITKNRFLGHPEIKLNDQELIYFTDEEHTTKIGVPDYHYKTLYMVKINLNTFQTTKTKIMNIGYSKSELTSKISDVLLDSNQMIIAYSVSLNPIQYQGDFPEKGALYLIRLNKNGEKLESSVYENFYQNPYLTYKEHLFMKDKQLFFYTDDGHLHPEHYYHLTLSQDQALLVNKDITHDFEHFKIFIVLFFIFLIINTFIVILLFSKQDLQFYDYQEGTNKKIHLLSLIATTLVFYFIKDALHYYIFLLIVFALSHVWIFKSHNFHFNRSLVNFYLLFIIFYLFVYLNPYFVYHLIDLNYFLFIIGSFSFIYISLIPPLVHKVNAVTGKEEKDE